MRISILGCGWLGLPLGESLSKKYDVKGSVTGTEKFSLLKDKNITPFCIDLNALDRDAVKDFLGGSDVLVISIPPKAAVKSDMSYPERIKALIPYIISSGIQKVLFTSSISVYAEGGDVLVVDHTTMPNPGTESGKQVLEAEQVLQGNTFFKTTIVRFGGLVGGARHPVYHLAGKQDLENPNGPVNLITREACVDILTRIIEKECWGEIFTAVQPIGLGREEYYTQKAMEFGLSVPNFNSDSVSKGKIVKGQDKLIQLLGFTF